jgi:polyisoprenoid-binding protein YceI
MMTMKKTISFLLLCLLSVSGFAQKFTTEKSFVSFYSHATIEDITAENKKSVGIFNAETSEIVFSIPIADFKFAKSLMQEHFNEKYMHTDKFPKASFKGKISGFDPAGNGVQQAKAIGKLNIHGVEKDVEIPGTIEKSGDKLLLKSKFIVKLEDYNIDRPQLLWQNIAEQVEVTIDFVFKPQ